MLFGLIFFALLLSGLLAAVKFGEKHIINLFVQEANQYLTTPVQVGRIELSLLDQFPRVSITLHHVTIRGTLPTDTAALARVRTLYCAFDTWDVLSGITGFGRLRWGRGRYWCGAMPRARVTTTYSEPTLPRTRTAP
ncbi:hypothetical protein [Hymenobacter sp. DG25B]|uniref:hypothetical protein n=1 Tax=Hymenobacter sp. DG25B TaxID=1385664 RepID=UPI000AE01FAA|nr:hypothetical protein [Hymenobacter sp. DG25B]